MTRRNIFVAGAIAVGLGVTGTAAAVGGSLAPEKGEAESPPVTALTAQIAPGLVYFHDSDGAVYAAAGQVEAAQQVAERCGFQPKVSVLEGARGASSDIDQFIAAAACDATSMKITLDAEGSADVFFLGSADDNVAAMADRLGLRLEVEVDQAG